MRIPKKVKTRKEVETIKIMEDDNDEESNESIILPEANFTLIRDKYQKKVAMGSANEGTQMALMLTLIMKTDKNVLSKTSAYGIQYLEAITVDFNGNGGNKMSRHPHRILFLRHLIKMISQNSLTQNWGDLSAKTMTRSAQSIKIPLD